MGEELVGASDHLAVDDFDRLSRDGSFPSELGSCHGLAALIVTELGLRLSPGRRAVVLAEVVQRVVENGRRDALGCVDDLPRHQCSQLAAFVVAAAGELLGAVEETSSFEKILKVRCKQLATSWDALVAKSDRSSLLALRRLRAALWLGAETPDTAKRNRARIFGALESAIRAYLARGDVADDLKQRFSAYDDMPEAQSREVSDLEGGRDSDGVEAPRGRSPLLAIRDELISWLNEVSKRPEDFIPESDPRWRSRRALEVLAVAALVIALAISISKNLAKVEESHPGGVGEVPSATSESAPFVAPSRQRVTQSAQPDFDNTHGWGPDRPTFTSAKPPPYVVFNSITDRSPHGDERNFLQCHDKNDHNWDSTLVARDGGRYECFLFFSNDVAANLDKGNAAAQMHNARVRAMLPSSSMYNPAVVGFLSADNAMTVWASCNFLAARPISISYVQKSARMFTLKTPKEGLVLAETSDAENPEGITKSKGTLLGEGTLDGVVRQEAGYVLFDITIAIDPK